MALNKELAVKMTSIVFAAVLYLPTWATAHEFDMDTMMVAKRGLDGEQQQLKFKGRPFPEVTYASRHDDIFLECEVGGMPSPTIHWLKDGERIQQGVSRDYQDDDAVYEERENPAGQPMLRLGKVKSRLYLDCISSSDVAKYTCVAETPTERISQTTYLEIEKSLMGEPKGKCLSKKAFRGEPARIHLWTAVRLEYEGAPAQLFCRADGFPAPKCSWRYSEMGDPIETDKNHVILPNGDLLLQNLKWQDNMGLYFCRCENEAGMDEVSTFLYPTSP